MRTSGDCVWEKQHIWNIPDGLKKVIAGVVTVSLLVGIGDAVSMVPLQEDMRSYAALRVKRYDGVFRSGWDRW